MKAKDYLFVGVVSGFTSFVVARVVASRTTADVSKRVMAQVLISAVFPMIQGAIDGAVDGMLGRVQRPADTTGTPAISNIQWVASTSQTGVTH